MPEPTIADMMRAYAEDCVDLAKTQFQAELDFSENSLEKVETILNLVSTSVPKGPLAKIAKRGPSDEQVRKMAMVWGAYVGEVIRRRWGGEWTTETKAQPGYVLTLRLGETDIFPPAKVYRRLTNGLEDNVWHYYRVLRQDFQSAQHEGGANV
jgi:hypothetical protein